MSVLNPPKAELVANLTGEAIQGLNGYVMVVDDEKQTYVSIAIPCTRKTADSIAARLKHGL